MVPNKILAKLLIIFLVLTFLSCEDNIFFDYGDDTDEAKLEQALIYLDEGNYSKAKSILENLDQNNPEVKRALASCYTGLAGLDVSLLISAMDSENTGIEAVGAVLGDKNDHYKLTASEVTNKLSDIDTAISKYDELEQTDSVKAQLVILHTARDVCL